MINQYSAPKDSRLTQCELILSRLEQIRQWLGEIESPPLPPPNEYRYMYTYLTYRYILLIIVPVFVCCNYFIHQD